MPTFSNYSVAQTASPYCPPVDSSRESTTVTKKHLESSVPVPPLDQFQFDLEDNLECGSWKSSVSVSSQSIGDEVECPDDIVTNNDNNNDQNNNHIDLTTTSFPGAQVSDVQNRIS
ncbi:Hypothetical predicted protein [Mytilus galloprovincialis]|uniref:Uncharacterized protein n=1 Tax=Mytilus galloprovincialis TaxID=29158 RepID=A0A8B6BIW8_MYTGA|nr:Hypothetical predicted protein [Mytilus galloprovincialis]